MLTSALASRFVSKFAATVGSRVGSSPGRAGPPAAMAAMAAMAAVAVGVLLSGCGGSPGSQMSAAPSGSAAQQGTVTLLTYDSFQIADDQVARFEKQTGNKLEIVRGGDGSQVVNRALLTMGAPEGDVLFGADNNLASRALDSGLFQPFTASAAASMAPELTEGTGGALTPIDVGDVCINYDKAALRERGVQPPTTLADLTEPQYKDMLVVEDPSTSTPGLAFMLATVADSGQDSFTDYWRALLANGVQVEKSWDNAYYKRFSGGSGEGKRPLVVSYSSSPAAEVVFAEGADRGKPAPTAAALGTCYRQVEYAGVLQGAANPDGAKALIDFMVGEGYQASIPLQNFVYPALPGVKLPAAFTDNAPQATKPLALPAADVAAHRDEWVQQWTDVVQP